MKALCLERDGYRCLVAGCFAKEAVDHLLIVPDEAVRENMLSARITHIVPFALGFLKDKEYILVGLSNF